MQFRELQVTPEHFELLDNYQATVPYSQFLQSSSWANFQIKRGTEIKLFSDTEKKVFFLAIKHLLPLGFSYYYIPRGPYFENNDLDSETWTQLTNTFRNSDSKALFIRMEPVQEFLNTSLKKNLDVQPSKTLLLNLKNSEEVLLAEMHQKTRYNIRLALKKELSFKISPEHCREFLDLLEETRQRDKFRLHSRSYYKEMIRSGAAELITVWNGKKLLAGSILATCGNTVTYVHGASSNQNRELMAPYFLHWQVIQRAKEQGYSWYDWHGIDSKKWPGVTRFKTGFGGQDHLYPGTFDLPLVGLGYAGYTIVRRLRRLHF